MTLAKNPGYGYWILDFRFTYYSLFSFVLGIKSKSLNHIKINIGRGKIRPLLFLSKKPCE